MDENENESNSSLISLIEVSENEDENEYDVESEEEEVINRNEVKLNNFRRAKRNWRKCLGCNENENLHRPTKKMRLAICKAQKIYIQANDRVCDYHLQEDNWNQIQLNTASNFSGKVLEEMIPFLLDNVKELESRDTNMEIGITETQFKQVLFELGFPENPSKTEQRAIKSIRLYMERLRHGHTYVQMANRHKTNRRLIGKKIKCGRNILLQRFVPNHLGYDNLNRATLLEHTTEMARLLYCNNDATKCVTILDGTYIYTCNTKNYTHQRKIYSGQMKLIAVDGTIIDIFGPFPANKNDAEIISIVFNTFPIENIFRPGDVVLLDRGFRDAVKFLKDKNLDVRIPEFIAKGTNGQLTTLQDNKSRIVTKMRYAIEVANGRMKNKWQLFNKIIPSILTKHLMADYKIGAALMNAFAKPIICDKNDYQTIAIRMTNCINIKNKLQTIIKSNVFQRTVKHFETTDAMNICFPRFDTNAIKNFALGTYSVKQAESYTAEHIRLHGEFMLFQFPNKYVWTHFGGICKEENYAKPMLICAKIKSRFRGQKVHTVYILYDSKAAAQKKCFMFANVSMATAQSAHVPM